MNSDQTAGRARTGVLLALMLSAAPVAAFAATASQLYYERSLMSAADLRCRLFSPAIASALNATKAQARGAALRSGIEQGDLDQVAQRAQAKASSVPCGSPDIAMAAGRVRTAFDGYSRMIRMTYPGDTANWRADRSLPSAGGWWRLAQSSQIGATPMIFGMSGARGEQPQLLAVADFGPLQPYGARLMVRDASRTSGAYLDVLKVGSTASLPLASRTAPRWAARAFSAEARGPADPRLLPAGAKTATAFRFPTAAADAMANLDPREAVTVEFLFAGRGGGETVRQAYVEVGDFAAGRAFMMAAR